MRAVLICAIVTVQLILAAGLSALSVVLLGPWGVLLGWSLAIVIGIGAGVLIAKCEGGAS